MSTGLRAGTNNDGYLQVNGTDVLTALSSGNVGIGTTSPSTPLEVVGVIKSSDPAGHYTQVGKDGQIELARVSGPGPYIDFKNLASDDYDCRIQQTNDGLEFQTGGNSAAGVRLFIASTGHVGINTTSPNKKLDVRGETTFGEGIQEIDLAWGTDTDQRVYFFSGASSATGASSDGVVALVNPNDNPTNTRIGALIFGNSVSGTSVTSNPGLKASIDVYTNTNVTNAADTGASIIFRNKNDNANLTESARITSNGELNLGPTDSFAAKLAIKCDASTTRHVKLLSNNNDWGWGIDTIDLLSGNVPLRLFQRWSFDGSVYERLAVKIAQANNGATGVARVAINDSSTDIPAQTFTIREDVSGGYGATLALQNKGGSVNNTATAIMFGVDTSGTNAPGQSDTANATITVTHSGVDNDADMRFWVHTGSGGNKDALKIVGDGNNRASAGTAVGEACRGGVAFGTAGFAIDRAWGNYPGFHVFHTTTDGFTQQGEVRFHGWNTSYDSYPEPNGADFSVNLRIDGSTYNSSDRRHKTNIVDNPYGLEEILQLQPRKFNRINSSGEIEENTGDILGFIAQEVMEIIPEAVTYYPDEDIPNEIGWCRSYSLSNEFILSSLVNAVKELSAKNDALESRIAALEG